MTRIDENQKKILNHLNLIEGTKSYKLGLALLNTSTENKKEDEDTRVRLAVNAFCDITATENKEDMKMAMNLFITLAGFIGNPVKLLTEIDKKLPLGSCVLKSFVKKNIELLSTIEQEEIDEKKIQQLLTERQWAIPWNARNAEGNTLFRIMFDKLMHDPSQFDGVLVLITRGMICVDLELKNLAGENIYSASYLTEQQKGFLCIAAKMGLITSEFLTRSTNVDVLVQEVNEILSMLENPVFEDFHISLYFEIVKLYLHCKKNYFSNINANMYSIWDQQIERISLILNNKKKEQLWQAISVTVLGYSNLEENGFPEVHIKTLENLLKNLRSDPEALNFTKEQLKLYNIIHPYEIVFLKECKRKFEIIKVLLSYDVPFNFFLKDDKKISLLHVVIMCGQHEIASSMVAKPYFSSEILCVPTCTGDTALHLAIKCYPNSKFILKLLRSFRSKNYDVDIRNNDNFTPLYLALNSINVNVAVKVSYDMLEHDKVSLSHECLKNEKKLTAFDLWISLLTVHSPTRAIIEPLLNLGILLLKKGACLSNTGENLKALKEFNDHPMVTVFCQEPRVSALLVKLGQILVRLSTSWDLMTQLENRQPISLEKLECLFTHFSKTRRTSDKKNQWEVVFESQLIAKKELEVLNHDIQQNNDKINACQKHISLCEKILSILILFAGNPEELSGVHSTLKTIFEKGKKLVNEIHDFKQAPLQALAQEVKEEKETKESIEWGWQGKATSLEVILQNGEEILTQINDVMDLENGYPICMAIYYRDISKALFSLHNENNSLIANSILMLSAKFIKKAEVLSRPLDVQITGWRKSIVLLNANITASLPSRSPFESMSDFLRSNLISTRIEENIKTENPSFYYGVLEACMPHVFQPNVEEIEKDLSAVIPAAFEAMEKERITLEEKIRQLKVKLASIQSETEGALSCVRKADTQAAADVTPIGKRPRL